MSALQPRRNPVCCDHDEGTVIDCISFSPALVPDLSGFLTGAGKFLP